MEEQHAQAGTPIYQQSQEKNAKWLWLLILLIIVGALVFAYWKGFGPFAQLKGQLTKEEASPTTTSFFPSSSPEASAGAELDKSEPKIRVLNGSGKAGAASSMQDLLEGKGYNVTSVGNADNYDFTTTIVRFKETFKKYSEVLLSDLSGSYSAKEGDEDLTATDSADIEVIVGTK